jgi:glutaminyl-tRNA synthetase
LYDWYLDQVYEEGKVRNKQREFARMNVTYMVTSKRKLQRLVAENVVTGWDDPRMPTISGMRRLGYTPKAIREFIDRVGSKTRKPHQYTIARILRKKDLNKLLPE